MWLSRNDLYHEKRHHTEILPCDRCAEKRSELNARSASFTRSDEGYFEMRRWRARAHSLQAIGSAVLQGTLSNVAFTAPREVSRASHRRGCHPKASIAQYAITLAVCRAIDALRSVPSQTRARLSSRGAMKATLETRRRTDKRTQPPVRPGRYGASWLAFELDELHVASDPARPCPTAG